MAEDRKWLDFTHMVHEYYPKYQEALPDVDNAWRQVRDAVYKEGALSSKMKELVALGIALAIGCEECTAMLVEIAVENNVTKAEIMEAVGVAYAMAGSPAHSRAWKVIKVLEELGVR